jgi:hypothetical protein
MWLVFFGSVGFCVCDAVQHPEPDLRHADVLDSARLAIVFMMLGWYFMLCNSHSSARARLFWTFGVATLGIHIVLAFGLSHRWSHAAAVEHVRSVGGFGSGIVVNYLFVLVWFSDALWWWLNPRTHAIRAPWLVWSSHGFLAFVVLNATLVFGSEEGRYFYGVLLFIFASALLISRLKLNKTR